MGKLATLLKAQTPNIVWAPHCVYLNEAKAIMCIGEGEEEDKEGGGGPTFIHSFNSYMYVYISMYGISIHSLVVS